MIKKAYANFRAYFDLNELRHKYLRGCARAPTHACTYTHTHKHTHKHTHTHTQQV